MKVFRERAGVIGDEPVWAGIKDGKEVRFATSLTRLLSALGCAVTELPAAEWALVATARTRRGRRPGCTSPACQQRLNASPRCLLARSDCIGGGVHHDIEYLRRQALKVANF